MALNTSIRGIQIKDAAAGNGLEKDGSGNFQLDLKASAGLKIDTGELSIEPNDFAGTGLEDDGSDNLRLAAQGNGIAGGAGSTLSIDLDGSTLKVGASGIALADLTDTYILVGNGSNVATGVDMTGDVTISNAGVTAIGATKVLDSMINDDVATGLAGVGLAAASGVLAVDLNELPAEATFDPAADYMAIEDVTDNGSDKTLWSVIATAIAGTGLSATNGVLAADAVSDNITESDIQSENESANCNGSTTVFNLTSEPMAASVDVYLNGLRQEEGSGKDFTLDTGAKTVTFATAPLTNDILVIRYIIND